MMPTHVSLIEKGDGKGVQARTVSALAGVLGVSLDWLFLGSGDEPTEESVRAAVQRARGALKADESGSNPIVDADKTG